MAIIAQELPEISEDQSVLESMSAAATLLSEESLHDRGSGDRKRGGLAGVERIGGASVRGGDHFVPWRRVR
jgi:hypothetical protein